MSTIAQLPVQNNGIQQKRKWYKSPFVRGTVTAVAITIGALLMLRYGGRSEPQPVVQTVCCPAGYTSEKVMVRGGFNIECREKKPEPEPIVRKQKHGECRVTSVGHAVCAQVEGAGADQCATDNDCKPKKHSECVQNQCVDVAGPGVDKCKTVEDCKPKKHSECVQNQCLEVTGAGEDKCKTHEDCKPKKHSECKENQCVEVAGAGADKCKTNDDCKPKTHAECQDRACVQVPGAGADKCSTDNDCRKPKNVCGDDSIESPMAAEKQRYAEAVSDGIMDLKDKPLTVDGNPVMINGQTISGKVIYCKNGSIYLTYDKVPEAFKSRLGNSIKSKLRVVGPASENITFPFSVFVRTN